MNAVLIFREKDKAGEGIYKSVHDPSLLPHKKDELALVIVGEDTYQNKDKIKAAGFSWNALERQWEKTFDLMDLYDGSQAASERIAEIKSFGKALGIKMSTEINQETYRAALAAKK
jgi:hypothetical protein